MRTPILPIKEFRKFKRFLPVSRGKKRCNDLLTISGIIFVLANGIPWRHLPEKYGSWATVYSRFNRWSTSGVWRAIFEKLRAKVLRGQIAMIDSTTIKAHRTSASMRSDKKPRLIGRSRGGLTTKIHFLCTEDRIPIDFMVTEGQVSDIKAAPALLAKNTKYMSKLLGDKGYDSDSFRAQLRDKGIEPCIPGRASRKEPIEYDKELYKKRSRIENMFGSLKDWRGIATRYSRCAHTCQSAICIAMINLFF